MAQTRLEELRQRKLDLAAELDQLCSRDTLTPGEQERFDRTQREYERVLGGISRAEERDAELAVVREKIERGEVRTYSGANPPGEVAFRDTDRTLDATQNLALRALDRMSARVSAPAADRQERLIRRDPAWSRWFEIHSRASYDSAFGKLMMLGDQAVYALNDEEREAMSDSFRVRRAFEEGATTTGGYAVPVFIDPSVIVTDQGADNPFLRICRIVDVTTSQWRGVSGAGVQWSFGCLRFLFRSCTRCASRHGTHRQPARYVAHRPCARSGDTAPERHPAHPHSVTVPPQS